MTASNVVNVTIFTGTALHHSHSQWAKSGKEQSTHTVSTSAQGRGKTLQDPLSDNSQ